MTSALPAGAGGPRAGASGEPYAVLSARGLPHRHLVRDVRLAGEPGALVLSGPGGRTTRVPVGPDGVVEALHVGGRELRSTAPGSLGAVDLHDADGALRHRLDLRLWVPEARELFDAEEALRRSRLGPVLAAAGVPVRPVGGSRFDEALQRSGVPLLEPSGPRLPLWFHALRIAAVVLALVVVLAGLFADAGHDLVLPAAVLLAASALSALALWLLALWRDRTPRAAGPVLRPQPGAPVSRRFLRTAHLRAEPDAIVAVDALGGERWLPRSGLLAVTTLAVTRAGTPSAALELRADDDTPRATLPYDAWCGGADAEALGRFADDAGLVLDRDAAPPRRQVRQVEVALRTYAPPNRARIALSTWPDGLPGPASSQLVPALSGFLLLQLLDDQTPRAVLPVVLVTVALSAGVQLPRLAVRHLWLDRRVSPS